MLSSLLALALLLIAPAGAGDAAPALEIHERAEARYLVALAAWNAGDAEQALAEARGSLELDRSFAPARLLEAYALDRQGDRDEASRAMHSLADDAFLGLREPEVHALARRWVRQVEGRRGRDAIWVGLAGMLVQDRDPFRGRLVPHVAAELSLPLPGSLALRLDALPPLRTFDDLSLTGPMLSSLLAVHLPLGAGQWAVDAAIGPSAWVVTDGLDPRLHSLRLGLRAAVGADVRLDPRVGLRLEGGWTGHRVAGTGTQGVDLRLMLLGYFP